MSNLLQSEDAVLFGAGAGGLAQDGVADGGRAGDAGPAVDQNGGAFRKCGAEGEDCPDLFEGGRLTIGQRRDDVIEVGEMDLGRLRELAAKTAFVIGLPRSQRVPDRNDVGETFQIKAVQLLHAADGDFGKPGHKLGVIVRIGSSSAVAFCSSDALATE